MRSYGKVSPKLWTGRLGEAIKGDAHAQALACYLVTGPHANLAGLYRLPLAYMIADLGYAEKVVRAALKKLCDRGYCKYDKATERIWVIEHLRHELGGAEFKDKDSRLPAVLKALDDNAVSSLSQELCAHYHVAWTGPQGGLNGASPQEQQQEQQQEQEQKQEQQQQQDQDGGAAVAAEGGVLEEIWTNARPYTEQVLKVIVRKDTKPLDRELDWATRVGFLACRFGHSWLKTALEAARHTKPEKPQAYLTTILDGELQRIFNTRLSAELASVRLPSKPKSVPKALASVSEEPT